MELLWVNVLVNSTWRDAGYPADFELPVAQRLWDLVFDLAHDPLDRTASWRAVEGLVTR